MEFHAWINPYRVKTSLKNELAPGHVYYIHPEWFVTYGDQLYFDPALPESRRHICMVITDIVSRYDVDAIHMDDYFYPYPKQGVDFPDDASFARYGGGFSNKADWRRSNVNVLIKKIHETVRELKPWVKFGVSPFGIYRLTDEQRTILRILCPPLHQSFIISYRMTDLPALLVMAVDFLIKRTGVAVMLMY